MVCAEALYKFCSNVFKVIGIKSDDAEIISETVVYAELRGISSHGIIRLPSYVTAVQKGYIFPDVDMKVVIEFPVGVILDAGGGFGQVAATKAVKLSMEKANEFGVGIVGIRNSNSFGMAGYFAERLALEGFVGLIFSNAASTMAPWGGMEPVLGTNPIAAAVPRQGQFPIVLDIATSIAARGKIKLAMDRGENIPLNWALDENGYPTTCASSAMKGTILPMSGHKGYGLSLIVDLITGVFTGGNFGKHVKQLPSFGKSEGRAGTCHTVFALNPEYCSPEGFLSRVEELVMQVKGSKIAPISEGIFLPGEIERNCALERQKNGIPLRPEQYAELISLGQELGVEVLF